MRNVRVLVSGASIAGPALAHWLHRRGAEVIVVEQSPGLRTPSPNIATGSMERRANRDTASAPSQAKAKEIVASAGYSPPKPPSRGR